MLAMATDILFLPDYPVVGEPVKRDGEAEDGDDLIKEEMVAKEAG